MVKEFQGFDYMPMRVEKLRSLLSQPGRSTREREGAICELKPVTEMVNCKRESVCRTGLREPVRYTSMCEILAEQIQDLKPLHCELESPRTPIKNRLVEQAARAYLQPAVVTCTQLQDSKMRYWQKLENCLPIASMVKRCLRGAVQLCGSMSSMLQELNWAQSLLRLLKSPKRSH